MFFFFFLQYHNLGVCHYNSILGYLVCFLVNSQLCFHLRRLSAYYKVDCVRKVNSHSPPVSIALLICMLGLKLKNKVFIIMCQQQYKCRDKAKGLTEFNQKKKKKRKKNVMKNAVRCQSEKR